MFTKGSKERQEPTLGVHLVDLSVKRELTVYQDLLTIINFKQYFWGHDVTALFNCKHTKFALKTLVYLFHQKGKTKALDLDLPSTTYGCDLLLLLKNSYVS